ncbi:hypothetical protein AV530_007596 [Patagioenas fasciata monilis]|uniref:Uncharacterized protein n=1 Tax=Patagioenas fasciata monilis TaxID=372326 RepID=A0A1V4JYD5_PATFA|nr:hypothetical protein AV530_007596 [Patagioenas fasciata monilis]
MLPSAGIGVGPRAARPYPHTMDGARSGRHLPRGRGRPCLGNAGKRPEGCPARHATCCTAAALPGMSKELLRHSSPSTASQEAQYAS